MIKGSRLFNEPNLGRKETEEIDSNDSNIETFFTFLFLTNLYNEGCKIIQTNKNDSNWTLLFLKLHELKVMLKKKKIKKNITVPTDFLLLII